MDDTLDTAPYIRNTDFGYPFNDIYYMVGENTYLGNLTADAWDPVSFQTATEGFTFTDLGAPESQNLFEFLADSFNLDYQLVGDSLYRNGLQQRLKESPITIVIFRLKLMGYMQYLMKMYKYGIQAMNKLRIQHTQSCRRMSRTEWLVRKVT